MAIASFNSSSILPSSIGCPILLPRSKGPINSVSTPVRAMASILRAYCQRVKTLYSALKGRTNILQSLFCFDLHNREQRIICLLQVLRRCLSSKFLHWKRRTKASLTLGWELCSVEKARCVMGRVYEWHNYTMRTGVKGSFTGCDQPLEAELASLEISLLTIQPSLAAMRTIGLTPQPAIAATASCIAASVHGAVSRSDAN